jgi:hypothetical protein
MAANIWFRDVLPDKQRKGRLRTPFSRALTIIEKSFFGGDFSVDSGGRVVVLTMLRGAVSGLWGRGKGRVQGSGFRVQGSGFRGLEAGFPFGVLPAEAGIYTCFFVILGG